MAATNSQSLTFRIGVFVLASIILLAILITLFGGSGTLFKSYHTYTIIFDYAPGVSEGTPVRRSGVRIGLVQSVQLDDKTGKVRVTVRIDSPHILYQDDQPILVQGALSGDTSIDFVQRPPENQPAEAEPQHSQIDEPELQPVAFALAQAPAKQPLPANPPQRVPAKPGSEFTGTTQPNVGAVLQELSKFSTPAQTALTEMQKVLERFDKMTPLVEETLRVYRNLGAETNKMLPELRRSNEEIQVTTRSWGRLGERLDVLLQANQDKLIKTLDNFNDTILRVANVFSEENQKSLATTLKNVSAGTQNLESISKNTDELLKESRKTVQRVNDSITQADQVLNNLQQATRPMAERSDAIMKNLDESIAKLNRTMTEVQQLLRAASQGDGTLRRLLVDPSLYNNLNDFACMLDRTLPRVDRILKDVEVFADKIARHPESLGVRGAISPSSGLKEVPAGMMHWQGLPGQ
jgi:phospholipid/cholesterol/gamma-HCH transport system substrate-binding protein